MATARTTRQGKRKPGTVLISFPAPQCVKAQLEQIAQHRGEESLSALMRKLSVRFITKHRAAKSA
jgi:hypothetical protein